MLKYAVGCFVAECDGDGGGKDASVGCLSRIVDMWTKVTEQGILLKARFSLEDGLPM